MKCFTFTGCQLKLGLKMTKLSPPNGAKTNKEIVFLGNYGDRRFNIARHVCMSQRLPAETKMMLESSRIIPDIGSPDTGIISSEMTKCIMECFPYKETVHHCDGSTSDNYGLSSFKPTPAGRYDTSHENIILRVKTYSMGVETRRRGGYDVFAGRPNFYPEMAGRGMEGGISWIDDIIVLHNGDAINVVTMGSTPDDDQLITNVHGRPFMVPTVQISTPSLKRERYAEEIVQDISEAMESVEPVLAAS